MKVDIPLSEDMTAVFDDIVQSGGEVYVVGGAVRDTLLRRSAQDIDVEIHGLDLPALTDVLSRHGTIRTFGASFGIVQLTNLPGVEFALPRRERKTGETHGDFDVTVVPDMDLREAARRRDFTVNALMWDYTTYEVLDFFGGIADLDNRHLRVVDPERFTEDPLRVLRAASMMARYDLRATSTTKALCTCMVEEGTLNFVSSERIYEEYCKILMASRPSPGFEFLREIGALPKVLADLTTTEQRLDYHPEGSVWNHVMLVVDVAALCRERSSWPLAFMWSALLHDIGKPVVTTKDLHSPMHAEVGAELFRDHIKIIQNKNMRRYIEAMIYHHMRLMRLGMDKIRRVTWLRLLKSLDDHGLPLEDLVLLSKCDKLGRGRMSWAPIGKFDRELSVVISKWGSTAQPPLVTGKDLIKEGFEDHAVYHDLLKQAYDLQTQGYGYDAIIRRLKDGEEHHCD